MTLRLVRPGQPVPLSRDARAQLAYAAELLPAIDEARAELAQAVADQDVELLMRASRRFLGLGGLLGEKARQIDLAGRGGETA